MSYPQINANMALIQSKFGVTGNFEVIALDASAGLFHIFRDNDKPALPWSDPTKFGETLGLVSGVTMIQSNYGIPGNLEVICIAGNKLQFFWRDSGPSFNWNGPFAIESNYQVTGNPVLIQSKFGQKGNFELVVPSATAGLLHFFRNNDDANVPWSGAVKFGQGLGLVSGVAMIQSNYGNPGNLEVICIADGQLQFFWRDSGPSFTWNGPFAIESNYRVTGNPVLIQSKFGQTGNFELVVPCATGGLLHFWRNNDDPLVPWSDGILFGQSLDLVSGVTMIQSNYGNPGNLEVICNAGGQLQFFFRALLWNGPFALAPAT